GVVDAVALIQGARVGVGGAGGPERRLRVGRTESGHPGAALCRVALPGRSAALGAGGDEAVGGAGGARAAEQLLGIAHTGRSAADRSGVAGRVLAGGVDSVALVPGARGAVGAAGGPKRRAP